MFGRDLGDGLDDFPECIRHIMKYLTDIRESL